MRAAARPLGRPLHRRGLFGWRVGAGRAAGRGDWASSGLPASRAPGNHGRGHAEAGHCRDDAAGRSNAFVGYGPEEDTAVIELTAYDHRTVYDKGSAFGHLALGFPDVPAACRTIEARGGRITRDPVVIASGKTIAFLEDPDGYEIELVQPA